MAADPRKYLWDAQAAANRIVRFTAGKSFGDYLADEMLRAAVERQFGIVGEALSALRCADPATAASIPECDRIIAFRNILIHEYAAVDDALVWSVVESKVPELLSALDQLLGGRDTP